MHALHVLSHVAIFLIDLQLYDVSELSITFLLSL